MTTSHVKPLLKFIAPLLLACAYSSPLLAEPLECVNSLFKYVDEFPIDKLGAKIDVKLTQEPNVHGKAGEVIKTSTYSSGENWISIRKCASCDPEESRAGAYIVASQPLPCGLKKGMTVPQITKILGEAPGKQGNELLIYGVGDDMTDEVIIHLVNGKLEGLLNTYY